MEECSSVFKGVAVCINDITINNQFDFGFLKRPAAIGTLKECRKTKQSLLLCCCIKYLDINHCISAAS